MKYVVIGFITLFDNDLKLKEVEVDNNATPLQCFSAAFPDQADSINHLDYADRWDNIEEIKQEFFNMDSMVEFLELDT